MLALGTLKTAVKLTVAAIVCFAFSCMHATAQSTDFSRPTLITSVPLVGEHNGASNSSYYYAFDAGPGDLLVTFDGHASRYSTSATLKLADVNRNPIGELYLVAQTSPSSTTKRFHLDKRQRIVLETVFHEDTSMGVLTYSVNVSGPVQLARAVPGATTAAAGTLAAAHDSAPAGSNKPRLHIEMRDGSSRDFDMADVRRIVVE